MNRHSLPFGVLAGVLLILSAGCTTTDRSPQGEYAMLSPHAGLDGAAAYGLWNTGGGKEELLFLVLLPNGIEANIVTLDRTGGQLMSVFLADGKPDPEWRCITLLPEGLFQNGFTGKIDTTPTRKIFVLSKEDVLQPVETSPDKLRSITPSSIYRFDKTELWRNGVKPLFPSESASD